MSLRVGTRPATVDPGLAVAAVQISTVVKGCWGVLVGALVLAGGPTRFGGAAYAVALLVPGAPPTWGLLAVLAGALTLAGYFTHRHRVIAAGLGLNAAWALFFAVTFAGAAVRYPIVGLTGVPTYLAMSAQCVLLMRVYRRSRLGAPAS